MEIEDGLAGHDSHLTSLFATFTRLTRQEEMPMREQLTPGGGGAGQTTSSTCHARHAPFRGG